MDSANNEILENFVNQRLKGFLIVWLIYLVSSI